MMLLVESDGPDTGLVGRGCEDDESRRAPLAFLGVTRSGKNVAIEDELDRDGGAVDQLPGNGLFDMAYAWLLNRNHLISRGILTLFLVLVFVYQNSGLFLRLYGVLRRAFVYTDVKTT